jgi:nitrate reductase gamma subunit
MADELLFIAFPYVAVMLAVVVGIYRYRNERFTYTSLSSQLLENRILAWASTAWHYSIGLILIAHVLAALLPSLWTSLLGGRFRLYMMEVTGMGLALVAIISMGLFFWRRMTNPRVRAVTTTGDWILLVVLLLQITLGFLVAFVYRWGALWYLRTATPWLESLVRLDPQIAYIAPLPWLIKLHFVGGFATIALLPFTRLIHAITIPVGYLWRPYRIVIWNRRQVS